MAGKSILILGGGFGGLTTANELRRQLGNEHSVTVVDKKSGFVMGLSKISILAGRKSMEEVTGDLNVLPSKGILYVQSTVTRIDPRARMVTTTEGEISFDYLVIALGADLSPGSVPGFPEAAYEFYTPTGAAKLGDRLNSFGEGRLMVLISSLPFKCPAAPYEAAMIMHDVLKRKGVAEKVRIDIYTPEPYPIPSGPPEVGEHFKRLLTERGIGFNPGMKPKEIDPKAKSVTFENGTKASYDLLAGVPTHVPPQVIKDSWLAGPSGWIPVNKSTLQTSNPKIFAIGDVAEIQMANKRPMPKLGVLAEEEGKVVAANIVADIRGGGMREEFGGFGTCFVEIGGGVATLVRGAFLAEPAPRILLDLPSVGALDLKERYEAQHLAAWF